MYKHTYVHIYIYTMSQCLEMHMYKNIGFSYFVYINEKQRHNVKNSFIFSVFCVLAHSLVFSWCFWFVLVATLLHARVIYIMVEIVNRINTCFKPQCRYSIYIHFIFFKYDSSDLHMLLSYWICLNIKQLSISNYVQFKKKTIDSKLSHYFIYWKIKTKPMVLMHIHKENVNAMDFLDGGIWQPLMKMFPILG